MEKKWTKKYGKLLLELARHSIAEKLGHADTVAGPDLSDIPDTLLTEKRGVFVTLHKNGQLRGCIGNIEPEHSVLEGVRKNAVHAAFKDSRFAPLDAAEFREIDIEVSLLTPPQKMRFTDTRDMLDKLTPFEDGVIVEKEHCRATFLPQVWEQLPAPDSFLRNLCTKAGCDPDAWQTGDLHLYTYQVQSFAERTAP
ncbi:MAG: AmmeMemoRadiSam system protein A [Desulfobacteraceae bacterium]|nr:AmmeMemoRadiSam system protein A [Desulfobacteraceae bacterium]